MDSCIVAKVLVEILLRPRVATIMACHWCVARSVAKHLLLTVREVPGWLIATQVWSVNALIK